VIFGIGTDIVAVKRIEDAISKHGERFAERILNERERADYRAANTPLSQVRFLAKRFAVKEAFSKAFGTGIGEAVSWHDVSVAHDTHGKPQLIFSDAMQARLDAVGITHSHLSISDEHDHAIAFVILEKA
jgi:holo-[acyl-carrier protein] synthase